MSDYSLTVLLEYIDLFLLYVFGRQEFMVMHKCSAYYASIMLNAFKHLLCLLLCQHNRRVLKREVGGTSFYCIKG